MATPTLDTLVVIRPGDSVDADQLFEQACRKNPHGKIEQDANGDVLIMAPTGGESSKQNLVIGSRLTSGPSGSDEEKHLNRMHSSFCRMAQNGVPTQLGSGTRSCVRFLWKSGGNFSRSCRTS